MILNSRESHPALYDFWRAAFRDGQVQPVVRAQPGAAMYSLAGILHLIVEEEGAYPVVQSLSAVPHPGVVFRTLSPALAIPVRMVWRITLPEDVQQDLRHLAVQVEREARRRHGNGNSPP